MDGVLGAVVAAGGIGAALVAWRWWLNDRADERKTQADAAAAAAKADSETLRLLPGRVAELEAQVKNLAWRKS